MWSCVILVICFGQTPSRMARLFAIQLTPLARLHSSWRPICTEVHSNVNELHWPQNKAANNQKKTKNPKKSECAGERERGRIRGEKTKKLKTLKHKNCGRGNINSSREQGTEKNMHYLIHLKLEDMNRILFL